MRQGNDIGTQYRSGIYCFDNQQIENAQESKSVFQTELRAKGYGESLPKLYRHLFFTLLKIIINNILGKTPMAIVVSEAQVLRVLSNSSMGQKFIRSQTPP